MKNKIQNKKAQLFSLIAIALIGFMFVSYEVYSYIEKRHPIQTRVSTMESFLDSIELNMERQLYIAGYRTIFLAETRITSTGNYIGDMEGFFTEAFYNGTVNGIADDILIGTTYNDIIDSVNEKGNKINVEISMDNPQFIVEQVDPWNIKLTLISDFVMEDKAGLARWEKEQTISTFVPVQGFEDPIFIINTNGEISHKINQTNFEGNYIVSGDTDNLFDHVQNGYYAANSNAPNFLMRLEGNTSRDPNGNGIESFVYGPELSSEGFVVLDKSKIDFIYFSSSNPTSYQVTGMPAWFEIDDEGLGIGHIEKYNVTGLTY